MDLAKIIADLRVELQCLNTAIASMEELARVQSHLDSGNHPTTPNAGPSDVSEPPGDPSPPVKRGRGRPRKVRASDPAAQPMPPASEQAPPTDTQSTGSAA